MGPEPSRADNLHTNPLNTDQHCRFQSEVVEPKRIVGALDDAIRILISARRHLVPGSFMIWRIVDNARAHLERQIADLLS
jgi:hypothetical protein